MDLQRLKHSLSALSLLLAVVAIVCYFTNELKWAAVFFVIAIVCKLTEIIVRIRKK